MKPDKQENSMRIIGLCKTHGETEFFVWEYFSTERNKIRTHKICCLCRKKDKHESYLRTREYVLAKAKEWRENNKEHKAKMDREYYLNNKEKVHKYSCEYQKKNGYKQGKKWKRENPDKVVEYRTRRKAFQYGATINDFTKKQWEEVLSENNNACFYCGCTDKKLTQDHIIPLFRGGDHTKSNIVPACMSCNCSKGIKLLSEWRNYVSNQN